MQAGLGCCWWCFVVELTHRISLMFAALCKNPVNDLWYSFDDRHVTECKELQLVTEAAYLLFYRRRSSLSCHSDHSLLSWTKAVCQVSSDSDSGHSHIESGRWHAEFLILLIFHNISPSKQSVCRILKSCCTSAVLCIKRLKTKFHVVLVHFDDRCKIAFTKYYCLITIRSGKM